MHRLPETPHERLLLLLPFGTDTLYASKAAADGGAKKGAKPPRIEVGTIVKGRVTSVKALQLNVELDRGLMGRVHVTEVGRHGLSFWAVFLGFLSGLFPGLFEVAL